jgi:N-acetyl-alpha-D-glucosaminyl L-malate synthase BshA
VIPNFVDPRVYDRARYGDQVRAQFNGGRKVLMHISNFRPVKRVKDVIHTFAKVRAKVPSVLVMVGDGPDRHDAEQEARELGVDKDVQFLGKIDNVAPLVAAADLFVLPTNAESFGLSALEALASGTPVIGTNVGGLPEVVRNNESGVLCGVGDVDGMASAAIELLTDSNKWKAMSECAAADARQRFAMDDVVQRYEALYQATIG